MNKKSHPSLTVLGQSQTEPPDSPDDAPLEAFTNSYSDRDYWVELNCPEFTSVCPITGQPDFGEIIIRYIPDKVCVESKSLKLYILSFRNHGAFHEEVVNRILDDIVSTIKPRKAIVTGVFNSRGGIAIKTEATYPFDPGNTK